VRSPEATVVVDLGPGTLANLQRHVELGDVDAVVLSHVHPDHWLDLPILRNALRYVLQVEGLAVYGTAETWMMAAGLMGELMPTLEWRTLSPASVVEVGDQTLRFSRTDHPVETLAVRVDVDGRSLLYSADTGPDWEPGAVAADVDLFLCEASLPMDLEGSVQHLSARQAGHLAGRIRAARLAITHVSPSLDDEDQRADAADAFEGPVDVAATGVTFAV
jgi:ribonuclease BN (tRNA processing enzyme)